jgi:hypothetical protein
MLKTTLKLANFAGRSSLPLASGLFPADNRRILPAGPQSAVMPASLGHLGPHRHVGFNDIGERPCRRAPGLAAGFQTQTVHSYGLFDWPAPRRNGHRGHAYDNADKPDPAVEASCPPRNSTPSATPIGTRSLRRGADRTQRLTGGNRSRRRWRWRTMASLSSASSELLMA